MSEEQMEVPKGYMLDARGNLVSKKNIKAIERATYTIKTITS